MRTARGISALLTTSKQQSYEGLFNILAILDTITRDNVYVIFVEAVNKMACKCQTASSLSFPSDFKAVRGVHARTSVELRSRKTQETRAAAGSFACLGRFARRTKRKERLLVVKCKINGETLNLMFLCIGKIFQPYHFKMVSAVPDFMLKSITLHQLLRCEVVSTQFESVEVSIILHSWLIIELEQIIFEVVVLFYV